MDVKYLNPFLIAIKDIATQVLNSSPSFNKPCLKQSPFNSDDLLIIIGITGEINGKAIINMNKTSCVQIASQMAGGMEMQFNEISKSATSEFFNMIMGATASNFEKDGIQINITSPTILEGSNIKFSQKQTIISVPVSMEKIELTVNISVEVKAA